MRNQYPRVCDSAALRVAPLSPVSMFGHRPLWHDRYFWILSLVIFCFAFAQPSRAQDIRLAWNAVEDPQVGGYEVAYGPASADYHTHLDAGSNTAITIPGLSAGTHYFSVRAYSADRSLWSDYAEEVSTTIPSNEAPSPPNRAPVANAAGPYAGKAGQLLGFNGRASSDADGNIVAYSWDFGDGKTGSGANPSHRYSSAGKYTVRLTVTDDDGAKHAATASAAIEASAVTTELREGFEGYAAGTDPLDWLDTGANNGLSGNDGLFAVQAVNGKTVFATSSTSTNIHSHYTGSALDGASAYEYSGRLMVTEPSGSIGVTFFSDYPYSDTYYRLRSYNGGSFHLAPHPDGHKVSGDGDTGVAPSAGTWYSFRIQVADTGTQTTIRAKIWAQGQSEPADWQIQAYDASAARLTGGTVGVWSMGGGMKYWDDLAVATDSDPVYVSPEASFTLDLSSGSAPLDVAFNSTSTGDIDSWAWDFGDGNTSTLPAPTHKYQSAGSYTVSLTVSGPAGSDSISKASLVTVTPPAPEADFAASATYGVAPLTVIFTDDSAGTVSDCEWDFGDGSRGGGSTAVHTYASAGTYTVALKATGPGGSSTKTKTNLITTTAPAPVARFASSQASGPAPLVVNFSDDSEGEVSSYLWSFGDGSTSTEANPSHTYAAPGDYDVTLTVTGDRGSDTVAKTDHVHVTGNSKTNRLVAVGEFEANDEWVRVDFTQEFIDPIVVANPLSNNGGQPAVIRVRNVDSSGFEARVQEWPYLDKSHATEIVSYLVVERGMHQLPNGTWIEAEEAEVGKDFMSVPFAAPFLDAPIVLASVTTVNEGDAVTSRLKGIDPFGFRARLQEQESSNQAHANETISYIAWEPSDGELEGLRFEVGRTGDTVTHEPHTLVYRSAFEQLPFFLGDMQTTDGPDTASLRYANFGLESVDVWVDEETSRDGEINHTTETVGYILLEPTTDETMMSEVFDGYTVDADPLDWLDTGASNSLSESDGLFAVQEVNGAKVFATSSTATNIHSHYVGPTLDGVSAYEYSGRLMVTEPSGGIGLTFFSDYPYSDTYYRLRSYNGGSFHIAPHADGHAVSGDGDTGIAPSAGTWYSFRIQVEDTGSQTEIRAKIWAQGQSEPADWQVQAYDASPARLTGGTVGVWSMGNAVKYWDNFSVSALLD